MKTIISACLVAFALSACIARHVTREIPPPGGCDQCHRQKISANWEVAIAPVAIGKEGGVPEPVDLVLRGLQTIPYHSEVPAKRLAVFAASAPPDAIGDEETGIQCFLCHTSPAPPHEQIRGRHPWGRVAP